jgi:succinoglycan biosynthesis protein ExoV
VASAPVAIQLLSKPASTRLWRIGATGIHRAIVSLSGRLVPAGRSALMRSRRPGVFVTPLAADQAMRLHYYDAQPNFGDALNEWLWDALLPGCWDPSDGIHFSGIGTIIGGSMPKAKHWVVFTSGVGYGKLPDRFDVSSWSIVSVRGPLTARTLGLPPKAAVTDGALLLASLSQYAPLAERDRDGIVFVPHYSSDRLGRWREVCERVGVEHLSPTLPSREVIERIRRARLVLADAMHAAIVADALRVPWIPMVTSPQISTFKWLDWTRSMELPYRPCHLPPSNIASRVQDSMLWATGGNHGFAPDTDDAAVVRFQRRNRLFQRRWWPPARLVGRQLNKLATRLAGAAQRMRPMWAIDEAYFDRAAASLAAASRQQGLLSRDQVFRDRLDALAGRLVEVRRIAGHAG